MALLDTATLVIGAGNFFTAPTLGEAEPADLGTIATPWVNVGHTSLEDIMSFESEGGEQTILGTLQNASLRTSRSSSTETISIILQQWDEASLKLFFGSNSSQGAFVDGVAGPKWLRVASKPQATECAFLAVFVDGENVFAIHMPRCEIMRGDNLEFGDTESLAGLPINITPLQYSTNDWTYQVTPLAGV